MRKLILPSQDGAGPNEEIEVSRTLVIIGSNGAGKSKLGYWIEQNQPNSQVHRVGAQRSLVFSDYIQPQQPDRAQANLHYGTDDPANRNKLNRWGGNPQFVNSFLLNDFDALLSLLFAQQTKRAEDYLQAMRMSQVKLDIPESSLDTVQRIWKTIMPQRELVVGTGKIEAQKPASSVYSARAMSDGERVTLYLIGQSICAPADAIVVVDEPEIHLHRAIQPLLWDQVEAARPDCLFIYITHDLDFAATRVTAPKIIVNEFDGKGWKWKRVPSNSGIPEEAFLTILGSRRPVLFVEGDEGSLDVGILRAVYPDRCIIPCGGCAKVIESTKAMRSLAQLHHLSPSGLVDRDFRTDEEVDALRTDGVFTAEVAEIENLFLIPEVVAIVAKHLAIDIVDAQTDVEAFVLGELQKELDHQILSRTRIELTHRFSGFGAKAKTFVELQNAVDAFKSELDPAVVYSENKKLLESIVTGKDYKRAIKFYNRKSLAERASKYLSLADGAYPETVLRLVGTELGLDLATALKAYLPSL